MNYECEISTVFWGCIAAARGYGCPHHQHPQTAAMLRSMHSATRQELGCMEHEGGGTTPLVLVVRGLTGQRNALYNIKLASWVIEFN